MEVTEGRSRGGARRDRRRRRQRADRDRHAVARARPRRGRRALLAPARQPAAAHPGRPSAGERRMTERPSLGRRTHVGHFARRHGRGAGAIRRARPTRRCWRSSPGPMMPPSGAGSRPRSIARPRATWRCCTPISGSGPAMRSRPCSTPATCGRWTSTSSASTARPSGTSRPRVTWQLGEPALLAERFGVRVVSGFPGA